MPQIVVSTLRNRITIFVAGFCLGAAFMASPAIGILLAAFGVLYLLFIR